MDKTPVGPTTHSCLRARSGDSAENAKISKVRVLLSFVAGDGILLVLKQLKKLFLPSKLLGTRVGK